MEKGKLDALKERHYDRYDVVLVDAPCTGSGTLRRAPDLAARLEPADEQRYVDLQHRLIMGAVQAVKPGGRIVYATCSVLPAENEDLSAYVASAAPELQPVPLAESWGLELSRRLGATPEARIGPGPGSGPAGFYMAQWRHRG